MVKLLKGLTKLEQEKQRKLLAGELSEELDATGQESETKAAKWVMEKGRDSSKEQLNQENRILEALDSKSKYGIVDYHKSLAAFMANFAQEEQFPQEWFWHIAITDQGVVMYMVSPDKRRFYRAFKPSFVPQCDLQAIFKILDSMWTKINELEVKEQGEGFFLPDG